MSNAKNEVKQRLQTILDDYNEAFRIANEDLSGWDTRTAVGAMNRKRDAQEQVRALKLAYRNLIAGCVAKVFVSGPRAEEFAKYANGEGAIVVDGSAMYKDFAKALEPSMDTKLPTFSTNQLLILTPILRQYMTNNGIRSLQLPHVDALDLDVEIKDLEALTAAVRKSIRNSNGDDLLVIDLTSKVLDQALEKKAATTVVPAIIINLSAEEQQSMATKLFDGTLNIFIEAKEESKDEDLIEEINDKILAVFKKA